MFDEVMSRSGCSPSEILAESSRVLAVFTYTSLPCLYLATEEVPVSGIDRNLAVRFGDVCRKRERLLALSRFLTHDAFEISGDLCAVLVPDSNVAVDRDAVCLVGEHPR